MDPSQQGRSIDQAERDDDEQGTARARRRSMGAGNSGVQQQGASALGTGEVIQVNLGRLADVLGCGLDELLHSLRKEATSEAEGIAIEGKVSAALDLDESVLFPPPRVRQALMTTVSQAPASVEGGGELPRPLWLLGGAGGKTIIELVLLNLMRGGVDRVVIVVGRDGSKIRQAVRRSGAAEKLKIEFLEDHTEISRQFHAKALLRAKGSFDSPFLFVTSDHLFHPGLLHQLAVQDLGNDGGCVLVEDVSGADALKDMATTAVFVRRAAAEHGSGAGAGQPLLGKAGSEDEVAGAGEMQASRRVMAIGRREQGQRQRWDGVECGALVLSTEIFDTLSALGKRRRYYTLADGLDIMAGQGMLRSVSTEGKPWLALETKAQLKHGHQALVQGIVNQAAPFPWEQNVPPKSSIGSAAAAATAAAAAEDFDNGQHGHQRRISLSMDPPVHDENEDASAPDFKGFIVPVEGGAEGAGGGASVSEDFLTRGHSLRRRVSLEDAMVHFEEPDAEAGEGGAAGGATVTLPWSGDSPGEVGFIVSVPGETGGEELVFAVPELPPKPPGSGAPCCGGGGLLGPCCGGAPDAEEEGMVTYDSDGEEDYNCLGGGILNACLPEMPSEMPSDIRSVRVTTEVVAEKEGEEATLAVHVIVDRSVPILGWVLMVSALFGCAAMAPMGDLISKMSPDTAPAVYPVWRYSCSTIIYSPWFLLMVAGSKSARAQLRDWSLIMPIVLAGVGLAGWGLCFYSALNFTSASMVALLASLTPMCLVVWRGVTGESVHILEIVGVLLALAGGVVSTIGEGGGDDGADGDATDTAAKTAVAGGVGDAEMEESGANQALGVTLGLGAACCGGLYILNAKAARNKVEPSHFAFIASIVPSAFCTLVLVAMYGSSQEGRQLLFGPSGLWGWTKSPGLALAQVVTSILGDMVGNFGFYLLLKYISPLVVSLASLTVPLLAVVEGLMLGVVSPPGILFGVGACLILIGAATASIVTILPHTEVFDATEAVKMANEGSNSVNDKSPALGSSIKMGSSPAYGAIPDNSAGLLKKRGSHDGGPGGRAHIRSLSVTDSRNAQQQDVDGNGTQPAGGSGNGEGLPLLSLQSEEKKNASWMPRMFK